MNRTLCCVVVASALFALSGVASADTLLVKRVHQEANANLPTRGMTMAQVQAKFGAPSSKLDPRGGQRRAWPTINRWEYQAFTVYFEHGHVIDAVMNQASPEEIGPKPATT